MLCKIFIPALHNIQKLAVRQTKAGAGNILRIMPIYSFDIIDFLRRIVIRGVYFERSVFAGSFGIANNNAAAVSVLFTVNLRFVAIAGEDNSRILLRFQAVTRKW